VSSPATGSFYGVATFVALAGGFVAATRWPFPSEDRAQMSITLVVFLAAGFFAMKVGKHRELPYLRAVGRALKELFLR
jgi:hypothetical protein